MHMPFARLLRFILLLAVLFAPVSMMNSHAAMAMPGPEAPAASHLVMAQAPEGHCADTAPASEDQPADDASRVKNCAVACSCIPPSAGQIAGRLPFTAQVHRPGPSLLMSGLAPQAEPRPPKLS